MFAHLARLHQLVERADDLLDRHLGLVEVRVVEVDVVGAQAAQGRVGGGLDVDAGQPRVLGVLADLGGDHDVGAVAARLDPLADDGLGLAALVARDPRRVRVGRVEEVAAGGRVRVEHGEGLRLVGGPAEDVAAEGEREDLEVGRAKLAKRSHA